MSRPAPLADCREIVLFGAGLMSHASGSSPAPGSLTFKLGFDSHCPGAASCATAESHLVLYFQHGEASEGRKGVMPGVMLRMHESQHCLTASALPKPLASASA